MKRLGIFVILLLLVAVTVSSCGNGGNTAGGEEGEKITVYDDQTFYWKQSDIMFISGSSSNCVFAADKLLVAIEKNVIGDGSGKAFIGNAYVAEEYRNEVIVGYVADKEISKKAYQLLERMNSSSSLRESRYLIYAEGGKIAIAFDDNPYSKIQSVTYAVDKFIEAYLTREEPAPLLFEKGVVLSGVIDLIAEQEQIDNVYVESKWEEYKAAWNERYGNDDLYWAFRTYYSMFSDELPVWWANLYDPAIGCFYSTPSGRDYDGFLPNPEAMAQIFNNISLSGATDTLRGGISANLPKYLQAQMVYYCKAIQDSNGYFYLPQLGKEYTDGYAITRRGRDIDSCTYVLGLFGEQPTYATLNGHVGDGESAEEYWAKTGLPESLKPVIPTLLTASGEKMTDRVTVGVSDAVSKVVMASDVVAVSTEASTAYMDSYDAFIAYLDGLNIDGNPYSVGNELNSTYKQIAQYSQRVLRRDGVYSGDDTRYTGMTLSEILIKYLSSSINSYGLYGDDGNSDTADVKFSNTNGLMKIIPIYNYFSIAYPKPEEAVDGILTGIMGDEPSTTNICEVYNCWSALSGLLSNVRSYIKDSELSARVLNKISDTFGEKGPAAVLNSYAKQSRYMKPHGTFSHAVVGGNQAHQGGLMVGLGLDEGNVDAVGFGTSFIVDAMCASIGVEKVPLYTESDWMRFVDAMVSLGPVVKYEYSGQDMPEVFDFEEGDIPTYNFRAALSDSNAEVIDMERNGEENKVLYVEKHSSSAPSSLVMNNFLVKKNDANMVYYSVDILVDEINIPSQLQFEIGSAKKPTQADMQVLFILSPESANTGAALKFIDFYNGAGAPGGYTDIGADVGRWFNLRLEFYPSSDMESFRYQVYINDTLAFVSKNVYSTKAVSGVNSLLDVDNLNYATLAMNRGFEGDFYFDNIRFGQAKKELEITALGRPDGFDADAVGALGGDYVGDNPPVIEGIPEVETFEKIPSELAISLKDGINANAVDKDGDKVLHIEKTVPDFMSLIYSAVNKSEEGANAVRISFDMLMENLTGKGGIEPYVQGGNKDYFLPYMTLSGTEDGSSVKVVDYGGGGATVDTGAKVGKWSTFTITYYPVLQKYELTVDGKLVLTGNKLRQGSEYPSVDEIDNFRLVLANGNAGDYYFDNLSISRIKLELPEPDAPGGDNGGDVPSDSFAFTFESGAVPGGLNISGCVGTVVDKGDGNKVLQLSKPKKDQAYNVRMECATVGIKEEGANVSVIGFDIMTDNVASLGNIELWLFEGGVSKYIPFFTYSSTEQGSPVTLKDLYKGSNGQVNSGIYVGSWVSIEIRYYSERSAWDVYANGEYIFTGNGVAGGGSAPKLIDKVMLNMSQALSADIYIDNFRMWHIVDDGESVESE